MCSCIEAFSSLQHCAVLIVGVSGNLPVHGIGVANFVVKDSDGLECIWRVHNCLLCHKANGEEEFNLLSVSQILRTRQSTVSFGVDHSSVTILSKKSSLNFDLMHVDGLYSIEATPICMNDDRFRSSHCIDVTLEDDLQLSNKDPTGVYAAFAGPAMKSPSRLGTWTAKILWIGKSYTLSSVTKEFG